MCRSEDIVSVDESSSTQKDNAIVFYFVTLKSIYQQYLCWLF